MQHLFHIAERNAWVKSVESGRYVAPSLSSEGFIHCSTREQVLETANRYYRGRTGLVLLCIDAARLSARLEFEAAAPVAGHDGAARSGSFPHVYGPLDLHAMTRVVDFEPTATGEFEWPSSADADTTRKQGLRSPADNLVTTDERIERLWTEFCRQSQVLTTTPYQAWYFGDGAALAHELADLVVLGPKRASTTLLWSVERCPALAPVAGAYSVVTELDGEPRGVIRTTRVEVRAFERVDAAFVWEEGEGDRSLDSWRANHLEYFSAECALLGRKFVANMPVVLERFELLYGGSRAS